MSIMRTDQNWRFTVESREQQELQNLNIDIEILLQRHDEQHIIAMYQQQGSAMAAAIHRRGAVDIPILIDNNPDNDDDDLDVDGTFDLNSDQEEERRVSRAELDDDTDSQGTLAEVSVVELNVSDDELAASIDLDGDNDTEDENDPLHTSTTNQSLPSR